MKNFLIGLGVVILVVGYLGSESEADKANDIAQSIVDRHKAIQTAELKEQEKARQEAFRNSPKGKTEAFVKQARMQCLNDIRARAKYPSKVDFNWLDGNGERYWMNFNSTGESRVLINKAGEMMNGLGMMVPFTAACKYDYNPKTNKYSTVEVLIG